MQATRVTRCVQRARWLLRYTGESETLSLPFSWRGPIVFWCGVINSTFAVPWFFKACNAALTLCRTNETSFVPELIPLSVTLNPLFSVSGGSNSLTVSGGTGYGSGDPWRPSRYLAYPYSRSLSLDFSAPTDAASGDGQSSAHTQSSHTHILTQWYLPSTDPNHFYVASRNKADQRRKGGGEVTLRKAQKGSEQIFNHHSDVRLLLPRYKNNCRRLLVRIIQIIFYFQKCFFCNFFTIFFNFLAASRLDGWWAAPFRQLRQITGSIALED